jgi:hypothetical protein
MDLKPAINATNFLYRKLQVPDFVESAESTTKRVGT